MNCAKMKKRINFIVFDVLNHILSVQFSGLGEVDQTTLVLSSFYITAVFLIPKVPVLSLATTAAVPLDSVLAPRPPACATSTATSEGTAVMTSTKPALIVSALSGRKK